jgi:hypothetical protein
MGKLRARLERWLAETHSSNFELRRHFFLRLFESEFVSVPGQGKVVAGGALAILISAGLMFAQAYYHKYLVLNGLPDGGSYRLAVLADDLFIVTLAMVAIGLFTTFQWPALFPGLRDCLALAAIPARMRDVFMAKFTALLAFTAVVAVAISLPTSVLLSFVTEGQYSVHGVLQALALFVSSSLAGLFAFFCLVSFQGVLLNILPVRHFQRVSLALQGLLLVVFLCGLIIVLRIPDLAVWMNLRPWWALYAPPLWFLGLDRVMAGNFDSLAVRLSWASLAGVAGSAAAALIAYWWSYRKQRTRVLESPAEEGNGRIYLPPAVSGCLLPNLRSLAVFGFIAKSLARSRQHRLILTGFAAVAVVLIAEDFVSLAIGRGFSLRNPAFREAAIAAPLVLSLGTLAGLRYLFRLPIELRANWLFRIHEPGHAAEFLAGVERFMFYCGAIPVAVLTLPVEMRLLGTRPGLFASVLCLLLSLILMEILLLPFAKVPFTSSYLPGRKPLIETVLRYIAIGTLYIGVLGTLVRGAVESPVFTVLLAALFTGAWWAARTVRLNSQQVQRLEFEEMEEPAVRQLLIEGD